MTVIHHGAYEGSKIFRAGPTLVVPPSASRADTYDGLPKPDTSSGRISYT